MSDIRIFDFDGSVTSQLRLVSEFSSQIDITDLTGCCSSARLWTSSKKFAAIKDKMFAQKIPFFSFLGSGDFHHFSLALIQQHQEPLTVVLFDNHPDWMRPPHQYHCGTWVYTLARLPNVQRIVIIGLESGDIEGQQFCKGDIESYQTGKIALLPFRAVDATLPSLETTAISSQFSNGVKAGIDEMLMQISTESVYISVDKDCLCKEDAFTNWEQGTMPLSTVLQCIHAIRSKFKVVGADTVGDYSPPTFISPLKWLGSMLDRPADALSLSANKTLLARNELANVALLNALGCHA